MTTENQPLREWRIDYENDTGNDDGAFWEWWTLTDGVRSFKCDSEADAQWLQAALTQPAQPAEGGEAVGSLTVSLFRGHLENTDFDYFGKLPPGTYQLYTAPPASQEQVEPHDMAGMLERGAKAWARVDPQELRAGGQEQAQQPSGGEVDDYNYFRDCVGESYTPTTFGKHSGIHPQTVSEALAALQGQPWADVIAALVFNIELRRQREVRFAARIQELSQLATPKPEPMTEHQRGNLVMEHLGPAALAGDHMSPFDAFTLGVEATERHHGITKGEA